MSHEEHSNVASREQVKILIASDHGGFDLKESIKRRLSHIEFIDVGTHDREPCDYPDPIAIACDRLRSGEADRAIVICGTGIGAAIAANKTAGIRAALCCNEYMAEMSRRHNDANVLALGARVLGEELALRIIERWIATPFEGGRHQRRIDKIHSLEGRRS